MPNFLNPVFEIQLEFQNRGFNVPISTKPNNYISFSELNEALIWQKNIHPKFSSNSLSSNHTRKTIFLATFGFSSNFYLVHIFGTIPLSKFFCIDFTHFTTHWIKMGVDKLSLFRLVFCLKFAFFSLSRDFFSRTGYSSTTTERLRTVSALEMGRAKAWPWSSRSGLWRKAFWSWPLWPDLGSFHIWRFFQYKVWAIKKYQNWDKNFIL